MILLLVHGQANVERSSIVNNTILKVNRKQYLDNHLDNHQSYEKTIYFHISFPWQKSSGAVHQSYKI